jgi:hypothetical protein
VTTLAATVSLVPAEAPSELLKNAFDSFAKALAEYLAGYLRQPERGEAATRAAALPAFMSVDEYARHARCSTRKLTYVRAHMEEGVHYSRIGRRVRYHVTEADLFLRRMNLRNVTLSATSDEAIRQLARLNASARRTKSTRA